MEKVSGTQKTEDRNIYQELAKLPSDVADRITNAKTGGGRSLNAIHESKTLNQIQTHLMLVLANELNFCKDFINQYRFISLNSLAEKLKTNKSTVSRLLNGYVSRNKNRVPGLIERGYVEKRVVTIEEQTKGYANHYCLTSKIFDEYMLILIAREDAHPSCAVRPPLLHSATPPSCTVRHKVPVFKDPKLDPLNAEAAAAKRVKPKASRLKTWNDKTEEERIATIVNQALDRHTMAVVQRIAKPYPYEDAPDIVMPVIGLYGLEGLKEFFDYHAKHGLGLDIRKLTFTFKKWSERRFENREGRIEEVGTIVEGDREDFMGCDDRREGHNILHGLSNQVESNKKTFSEKIAEQIGVINLNTKNLENSKNPVKVEDFPIRFRNFYNSLPTNRQKIDLQREILKFGWDMFFEKRATAILKCNYQDLFLEEKEDFPFFVPNV